MIDVKIDGHLGRGDHLEYLAWADDWQTDDEVVSAVRQAFLTKFGAIGLCSRYRLMSRNAQGYCRVTVWPPSSAL